MLFDTGPAALQGPLSRALSWVSWLSKAASICWLAGMAAATASAATNSPDFGDIVPSADARYMAQWVLESGDHQGVPFAIVDKKAATLFVFNHTGRLQGAATALLGLAPGDHSVADIGQRAVTQILPSERTTPAGRFASEPGHNLQGEDIVWVDYDAALAIHRLRPAPARERRPQRLRSKVLGDKRISLGCVIVAVDFYEAVVAPLLGRQRGVVYVLPETRSVQSMFGKPMQLALQ